MRKSKKTAAAELAAARSSLLASVKQNLIIEHDEDDTLISRLIPAAVDYAEKFQHLETGFYAENAMSPNTENAVIMLVTLWYESRDGATGGFFMDTAIAGYRARVAIDDLLRLDREWGV